MMQQISQSLLHRSPNKVAEMASMNDNFSRSDRVKASRASSAPSILQSSFPSTFLFSTQTFISKRLLIPITSNIGFLYITISYHDSRRFSFSTHTPAHPPPRQSHPGDIDVQDKYFEDLILRLLPSSVCTASESRSTAETRHHRAHSKVFLASIDRGTQKNMGLLSVGRCI
ncbi:hypothetical protein BGZ60DRAFT_30410 [Tricladium varicosporioides]|nr:hypothetical protein BGZ60DRAFT_30410 [Hymenoscyphus varicosporioides]